MGGNRNTIFCLPEVIKRARFYVLLGVLDL